MIKCTTVGLKPSDMCYEICVMARRCGALKAWERERKNGSHRADGKRGRVMSIYLGNLSIEEIEKRTGITLTDEHRQYMNEHRQMEVNSKPIKEGFWHGFDIPFMLMTSDKETAQKYVDILSAYDWSKCKEALRIGY